MLTGRLLATLRVCWYDYDFWSTFLLTLSWLILTSARRAHGVHEDLANRSYFASYISQINGRSGFGLLFWISDCADSFFTWVRWDSLRIIISVPGRLDFLADNYFRLMDGTGQNKASILCLRRSFFVNYTLLRLIKRVRVVPLRLVTWFLRLNVLDSTLLLCLIQTLLVLRWWHFLDNLLLRHIKSLSKITKIAQRLPECTVWFRKCREMLGSLCALLLVKLEGRWLPCGRLFFVEVIWKLY